MKRFLIALIVIVCLVGVGFLGYTVFNSKSVESIELEGTAQTLYFVNESSTPKFDDAKLKVTYKNGSVKYISMDKSSVKVTSFSTSVENHGEMTITYKSQTMKLEYNVIKVGYYYVKQQVTNTASDSETTTSSSISDANTLLFFDDDGALKYYRYSNDVSAWLLCDGNYDSNFNYKISGDSLVINYQINYASYTETITANYTNGEIVLSSTVDTTNDNGFVTKSVVKTYACNNSYKTNVTIHEVDGLYLVSGTITEVGSYKNVIKLGLNATIASDEIEIYVKVTYNSPIITFTDGDNTVNMLQTVYVMLTDDMVALQTSTVNSTPKLTYLCYENYSQTINKYEIYYIVGN